MATRGRGRVDEKDAAAQDVAATYNAFKEFEGRRYTGMRVGRGHKWNYDPGVWVETKVAPDEWRIEYAVTKRRTGRAPEGSGVPVGTGYHWYILAHQNVTKLNANEYTTSMTGMKFKLAHRRADKGTWSASTQAQRRNLVKILQRVIADLEREAQEEEGARASRSPSRDGARASRSRPANGATGRTPRRPPSRVGARQQKLALNGRAHARPRKSSRARHVAA
jgi:hypothetical protein